MYTIWVFTFLNIFSNVDNIVVYTWKDCQRLMERPRAISCKSYRTDDPYFRPPNNI